MDQKSPSQFISIFSTALIRKRLFALFKQKIFIIITVWGHLSIAGGAAAFYYFEHPVNPRVETILDTIFWTITTVTTVGYGDIVPITVGGKIVAIVMMVLGSIFIWSYTALFVGALVEPEISLVEKFASDEKSIHDLLGQIELLTQELKRKMNQDQ